MTTRGLPVPNKPFTFRGPPSALGAAADFAGSDVLSVANNHSLDYGREAFFDTLALVRAAGIAPVGEGRDLAAARQPAILSAGGRLPAPFAGNRPDRRAPDQTRCRRGARPHLGENRRRAAAALSL